MARAVLTVLILLVVVAYLSLFLAWNADPAPITTLELGASEYTQDMPVGLLFIAGVMVGALAMAIALWGPWKLLKASEEQQSDRVGKAREKLKSQSKEIKALTEELEELTTRAAATEEPSSADEVPLPEAEAAAVATVEDADATSGSGKQEQAATEDDPEVV